MSERDNGHDPLFTPTGEHYPLLLLLIIVLLVTMGVMVQSAVNAWLKDKSYQIVDITHAIQSASIPGVT